MQSVEFEVALRGSHSLVVPDDYALPFIKKGHKRVRVVAKFEGRSISFHAAIQQYQGRYVMTFGKRYQKELGVFPNDYFQLQFFEDTSRYGVDMPEELQAVLDGDMEAMEIFSSFTEGKIRSIIYIISRYKNVQTRVDKSLILAENLKRGVRDSRELFKSV